MKFLVDQQLPPALAMFLVSAGHQAQHVREIGLKEAEDAGFFRAHFLKRFGSETMKRVFLTALVPERGLGCAGNKLRGFFGSLGRTPVMLAVSLLGLWSAPAQTTVYSQDFESGSADAAWSGGGSVQSSQGLGTSAGFGQWHLKNDGATASVLTLTGLAAHTGLNLDFSLAIWDSVDANPGSFPYGDRFIVQVDGADLINVPFGNYGAAGGVPVGPGVAVNLPLANYGYGSWIDSAWVVSATLPHTGSTAVLTFAFPNSQGGADESFGIDNLRVSVTAVPEPGSWRLMSLGGLALAGALRRRKA